MNAKRVTLRSLGEGGYASAGFAEVCEDATAVKPWSFTFIIPLKIGETRGGFQSKCAGKNSCALKKLKILILNF